MKRIVLALVGIGAVLYAAAPVIADGPAPAPQPVVTAPGSPVVVAGSTDVYTPAPVRRGLFARIRERRNAAAMTTMPLPTGAVVSPTPSTVVPQPIPTPVPSPMPTIVIPSSGVVTTPSMVTTAGYTVPAARTGLFSRIRNRNRGAMTTVPMTTVSPAPMTIPMSAVVPASGTLTTPSNTAVVPVTTMPVETVTMASTTTRRMGLFARLRARRGN